MKALRLPIAAFFLLALCPAAARADDGAPGAAAPAPATFVVKPYLQLGHAPGRGTLRVLWQTPDADADWSVEHRAGGDGPWKRAEAPAFRRVAVEGIEPHRVYRATLTGLEPGTPFRYRVLRRGEAVFAAEARAPRSAGQPHRFVVFGDCGAGTPEQKPIAYRAAQARPDFVMVPGDLVYERGLVSEYRQMFWPVYNADEASPTEGAPLLRSVPLLAAPGNHDTEVRDLGMYPDGLAYYYYWELPLNGPIGKEGGAFVPALAAPEGNRRAFREAAGDAYPRMANYSFDYGNAHWTIVDSNPYVDWTDQWALP